MPHSYRRTHDLLGARIRDYYGLGEAEAAVILSDVLANLEALVGDLVPREDVGLDAGRSPQRLLEAIETMAAQLDCTQLADLVADAMGMQDSGGVTLPDKAVEPLLRFAAGLRKVSPEPPKADPREDLAPRC
jgi:hypothetical protein